MIKRKYDQRKRRRVAAILWCLKIVPCTAFVRLSSLDPSRNLSLLNLRRPRGNNVNQRHDTCSQVFMSSTNQLSSSTGSNIAVALDMPLIPTDPFFYTPRKPLGGPAVWFQSLTSLLDRGTTSIKVAAAALVVSLIVLISLRSSTIFVLDILRKMTLYVREKFSVAKEAVSRNGVSMTTSKGKPMTFDPKSNEGWGVCTLNSKRRLGKSGFAVYDFDLPDPNTYIDLDLGQQIALCCLDNQNEVVTGEFFCYHHSERRNSPGGFSILAPNPTQPDDIRHSVGPETARFVNTLKKDIKVGDEVAVKPGARKLEYKGQYLPVTDMVYVAHGTGIVPVLEQVRAVLPTGSSSVKSVAVAWINNDTKDFDVNADLLEREYFRYRKKMSVSCIVEDLSIDGKVIRDSVEINAAVPGFQPGTMAVVAGPEVFAGKTVDYLRERGYPRDTICVL